jgi:O-antigen ligase
MYVRKKVAVLPTEQEYLSLQIRPIWNGIKAQPVHVWLMLGYLFFEYVRPQSTYPWLAFLPWGSMCMLLAIVTRFADRARASIAGPLFAPFLLFFLVALLSSLLAYRPDDSFARFMSFVNWMLLYIIVQRSVSTKFQLFLIMALFVLASFKMAQFAAISWIRRGMSYEGWGIAGGPGYFGNAADMGVQMLLLLGLSLGWLIGSWKLLGRRLRWFLCAIPVSAAMAVVATGERGTLVGLATMGMAVLLQSKNKLRNLLVLCGATLLILQIMPEAYKARFETMGEDGTSQARLRYWTRGMEIFRDHPVIGIGFNNWQSYYAATYPGESLRSTHQEVAHSTPVTLLAEMGVLGFATFYGIALGAFILNWKTARLVRGRPFGPVWSGVANGLSVGLWGFLAASVFVTEHEFPFLFVHAIMSAALYRLVKAEAQVRPP